MLRLVCALFVFALLPLQARAAEGAYRYCTIGDGPVTLLRTVRADGSFAFQSSQGAAIAKANGGVQLGSYLAWPQSANDAPVLRIVGGDWGGGTWTNLPDDSELGIAGPDKVEDRTLATTIPKWNFIFYDLDPVKLLDRFSGVREVTVRFYRRGERSVWLKAKIDLEALRAALAETRALLSRQPAAGACGAAPASLTRDRDIAQYTDCRAEMRDETGGFWATPERVTWQYRFSPNLWLDADTQGQWQGTDADFATRMQQPFGPASPFALRIVSDAMGAGQTVTVIAGDKRFVMRSNYYDPVVWADLTRRDVPIEVELRDAKGKVTERHTLPPNWFATAERNLIATFAKVVVLQRDPMRNCAPPPDIIVT